jgi:hypothetical protein
MNYIKHLTGFFDKVVKDRELNPTHVSLYMALFQFWNCNRFKNPISISRDEVMRISKISSRATYHKCLKNLHSFGYIKYEPSYNPFKGSYVYLLNLSDELKPVLKKDRNTSSNTEPIFEPVSELVVNKSCTGTETSPELALVPYINNTNITNNLNNLKIVNLDEPIQNFQIEDDFFKNVDTKKKEKSSAKKEKDILVTSSVSSRAQTKDEKPTIENVKAYFLNQNFPELEANKFFNYFSSNGWLVGGKSPMVDWQASAKNWMLNANKFNPHEQQPDGVKYLNTTTDKDYSEPL